MRSSVCACARPQKGMDSTFTTRRVLRACHLATAGCLLHLDQFQYLDLQCWPHLFSSDCTVVVNSGSGNGCYDVVNFSVFQFLSFC